MATSPSQYLAYKLRVIGSHRITPLPVIAAFSAPVLIYVGTRYQNADYLSELTIYRIGNAASVLFGETDYIKPVQGLPIALLSKLITWFLLTFGPQPLISTASLSLYMLLYFGTVIFIAIAAIILTWPRLTYPQRYGVLALFGTPWLAIGSLSLLLEPDYWVGEWSYLIVSFCLLATMKQRNYPPALIGAWLAVGVLMKITLIGIAPLFFKSMKDRTPRQLAKLAVFFVLAYVAIDVVYMGNISTGFQLLKFQLIFFAIPNDSATYQDVRTFLGRNPSLIAISIASIAAIAMSRATIAERCLGAGWLLGFAFLLWRRPHDTSIASTITAATFLAVYFANTKWALLTVSAAIAVGAWATNISNYSWAKYAVTTAGRATVGIETFPGSTSGMLFFPNNYWNAGVAVQAMGYNGELGYYYPIESAPDGMPRYQRGAKAFQALFPKTVMIADSAESLAVAERALKAGVPMWWTQADPLPVAAGVGSLERVLATASAAGASVETTRFVANGQKWILYRAQKKDAK